MGMPFSGFDTFEQCTLHFANDPDVDDENALCGWLQAMTEKGELQKADRVIFDIDTQKVSLVDKPAVTSSQLMFKSLRCKDEKTLKKKFVEFIKGKPYAEDDEKDDDKPRYKRDTVFGAVLVPDITDGNGEIAPPWAVVETAHKWMEEYQAIDHMHSFEDTNDKVVESWVPEVETKFKMDDGTMETYPAHTWFMIVKPTEETKALIKSGHFTGFSIAGKWGYMSMKAEGMKGLDDQTIKGLEVEKEHNGTYRRLKEKTESPLGMTENEFYASIVQDHLAEIPDYYDRLPIVEMDPIKSRSEHIKKKELNQMEEEQFMELFKKAMAQYEQTKEDEQSRKDKDDDYKTMKETIESLKKELEELKSDSETKEDDDEDEEDEKKEDEEDDEEDEKQDDSSEEEEEEAEDDDEKQLKQKAKKDDTEEEPKKKSKEDKEDKAKTPGSFIKSYKGGDAKVIRGDPHKM